MDWLHLLLFLTVQNLIVFFWNKPKIHYTQLKQEYCFAKERQNVFEEQKQSVPMSNGDLVKITASYLLLLFPFMQNSSWLQKMAGQCFFER